MNSSEKKQVTQRVVCYLKLKKTDAPIYKIIKEVEKEYYGQLEINEWYIDILDEKISVCPEFHRLIENILSVRNYCDVIITLDIFQISSKEYGRKVIDKILENAGIELKTVNKKPRNFFALSMLDMMNIQLEVEGERGQYENVNIPIL